MRWASFHAQAIGPVRIQAEPAQLLRFFPPALLGQQVGQPPASYLVAGVGPGAQFVRVVALGQEVGQPLGGVPVAGVGARAIGQYRAEESPAADRRRHPLVGGPCHSLCRISCRLALIRRGTID